MSRFKKTGVTPGSATPRFAGYDVMGQSNTWDAETASVVLRRLAEPPSPPRFFSAKEEPTARALFDCLLAQFDEPKVPVFEAVDASLAAGESEGYHHADLPGDPAAWRWSLQSLDQAAQESAGARFGDLERDQQRDLIEDVRLADGDWQGMPAQHVFKLWMRGACSAFYSHPWAWNEIGFGGPAYPRGYKHLALDSREPWEVAEHDAHDPVPWAERAEAAKKRHAEGLRDRSRE